MRVLITGTIGFTGLHLAEYLSAQDRGKDNIDLYGIHIVGNPSGNAIETSGDIMIVRKL